MSADPGLAEAVASNQVLLGPMRDEDLRRAIAEPARLAGLRPQPGLIDPGLRDLAREPGAPPPISPGRPATWGRPAGRAPPPAPPRPSGGARPARPQAREG